MEPKETQQSTSPAEPTTQAFRRCMAELGTALERGDQNQVSNAAYVDLSRVAQEILELLSTAQYEKDCYKDEAVKLARGYKQLHAKTTYRDAREAALEELYVAQKLATEELEVQLAREQEKRIELERFSRSIERLLEARETEFGQMRVNLEIATKASEKAQAAMTTWDSIASDNSRLTEALQRAREDRNRVLKVARHRRVVLKNVAYALNRPEFDKDRYGALLLSVEKAAASIDYGTGEPLVEMPSDEELLSNMQRNKQEPVDIINDPDPLQLTSQDFEQEPIPANVYFDPQYGNFYDAKSRGMGTKFFHKWEGRANEFPTELHPLTNGEFLERERLRATESAPALMSVAEAVAAQALDTREPQGKEALYAVENG